MRSIIQVHLYLHKFQKVKDYVKYWQLYFTTNQNNNLINKYNLTYTIIEKVA